MDSMNMGVCIPAGAGREDNVNDVLRCLSRQTVPIEHVVIVVDGPDFDLDKLPDRDGVFENFSYSFVTAEKHEPGMIQPRNLGFRWLLRTEPWLTHVAFLDSDVIVADDWHKQIIRAYKNCGSSTPVMVCPYDWMPSGVRHPMHELRNDPRWRMFWDYDGKVSYGDISAGLACFSGNLVWSVPEFQRVGGFWDKLYHGRCEDGELGLRAVAMGVGIACAPAARGWHIAHPINTELALERNKRDVPMLNERHPWVEGSDVFMVDRDGKAFDAKCSGCGELIETIKWWDHVAHCKNASSVIKIKETHA